MASINRVTLLGNLVKDVEVKFNNNQDAYASISICVNERRKRDGEWVDEANFFDVKVFGKQAEWLGESGRKGAPVVVDGRLQQERWTDKSGVEQRRVVVLADRVQAFSRQSASSNHSGASGPVQGRQSASSGNGDDGLFGASQGQIPF
ncbi:MAG: single-stranded DNA-binding protein [Bacteroidota bacterium]